MQDDIYLSTTSSRSDLTTVNGIPRLILSLQLPFEKAEYEVTSQFANLYSNNCTLVAYRIANVTVGETNITS